MTRLTECTHSKLSRGHQAESPYQNPKTIIDVPAMSLRSIRHDTTTSNISQYSSEALGSYKMIPEIENVRIRPERRVSDLRGKRVFLSPEVGNDYATVTEM